MDRKEVAVEFFKSGYNCCQAVACAYADKIGTDETMLFKAGEGFGSGMGTANGVCGALSGAVMLAGMKNSDGSGATKSETRKMAAAMQKKFVERAKALICRDIKTGNNGGAFTSCEDCVRIAAEIVEEELGL